MMRRRTNLLIILLLLALSVLSCGRGPRYRLQWQLPRGMSLEYLLTTTSRMEQPEPMRGHTEVVITVRAPREALALLDSQPRKVSLIIHDKEQQLALSVFDSFRARSLMSQAEGLDPYKVLEQDHRNIFEMLFPLPEQEVAVGDGWPISLRLITLGAEVSGRQESTAHLRRVWRENDSTLGEISLHATLSGEGARGGMRGAVQFNVSGKAIFDITHGRLELSQMQARVVLDAGQTTLEMTNQVQVNLSRVSELSIQESQHCEETLAVREAVHQAIAIARAGQYQEALNRLEPVLESGYHDEHPRLVAAQVCAALQDGARAERLLAEELARFPRSQHVLIGASQIYRHLNQHEKAQAMERRLEELGSE